ncbi:hypothetical protein [Methylocella sp.]|jgi:hypothetical protein|uniref:hypothetical protein n=1 Tax=Methylocella sp. TaxID=1978226 RepID=UPI003C2A3DDC
MNAIPHIFAVFVGLFIAAFLFYAIRRLFRAQSWKSTTAVVRHVETISDGDIFYYKVTVGYIIDGVQYLSTLPTGIQYENTHVGDAVSIIYDEKNPGLCDLPDKK